ncbi:MAG: valine--tRNA ligase [Candidatus Micrarchaeota archaeon]
MLGKLDFKAVEARWAGEWEARGTYEFDESDAKRPVYSIDSPPPFTSGALHMGHVLSYSYFDFAARFKRMQGYNVFFPQGWDCQGFPTELKVEKKYGKDKLSREEFKQKCIEFTDANITAMKSQMARLGFSPDWKLEYRTNSQDYHRRVQHSLVEMFEKGKVYRAKHPVQFCTYCRSAIAKAETDEVTRETALNYIKFPAESGCLLIATTRPELLHACVAVLVHPQDERHSQWVGKSVSVPLFNRSVKVIADADVDKEFGTGAVMVCTFGDKTDVAWTYRHKLAAIEAMAENGTLCNAGSYDGIHVAKAREKIIEDLQAAGLLERQEKLQQSVKTHDRCGKPVEFLGSMQWFIKLAGLEEKIISAGKKMRWIPDFAIQYLVDWAEFVEYDWVISRQRIYGTPLPFYYCKDCGKTTAAEKGSLPVDPALQLREGKCECGGTLAGESATCDVWVDSSITPLVIGGWPDEGKKDLLARVYPASLRPQGLEIIRTWAFYTIARCLELTGVPPFKELLINGSVLGTDGKKMSKSVGNYEDPDELLVKYPADALRMWAALSGAFARDRPFSYKDVEHSKAFLNKMWNASKLVEKALEGGAPAAAPEFRAVDKWLLSRLNRMVKACGQAMNGYDYYSAITTVEAFFWHEFCDYYLEDVKYRIYGDDEASKAACRECLRRALLACIKLMAPFAPFTAEELYSQFGVLLGEAPGSVHTAAWPTLEEEYINDSQENTGVVLHSILSEVRKFKASKGLALNEEVSSVEVCLPQATLADAGLFKEELENVGRAKAVSFAAGEELKVVVKV